MLYFFVTSWLMRKDNKQCEMLFIYFFVYVFLQIPDNTVDLNEREQGAVKWFPHVRKKILSSQSEFVTMVSSF